MDQYPENISYAWLLVAVAFAFVAWPLLARFAQLLAIAVTPKALLRHKVNRYKVAWIAAEKKATYWHERYMYAVANAEEPEYEEEFEQEKPSTYKDFQKWQEKEYAFYLKGEEEAPTEWKHYE